MSQALWFPHLTVAAIIEKEGRFLCVEEHPRHNNVINQPAGHIEHGESIEGAIVREMLEETGYDFTPREIIGLYYIEGTNGISYLRICFTGKLGAQKHTGPIDPDITQTHWFSLKELKQQELRSPVVLDAIDDYLDGIRYPLQLISNYICPHATTKP